VVRITADQTDVILDVLSNDDLKGANPRAVTLSIVAQPSSGSVTVLPADNTAAGARPRLAYRQGASRLAPGDEAEVFYTLAVPGQPTPAPASALVIGSGECGCKCCQRGCSSAPHPSSCAPACICVLACPCANHQPLSRP
jgi:hypothetical protein